MLYLIPALLYFSRKSPRGISHAGNFLLEITAYLKNIIYHACHCREILLYLQKLIKHTIVMTAILHFLFVVFGKILGFLMLLGTIYWAIFITIYLPYAAVKDKLGRLPWL